MRNFGATVSQIFQKEKLINEANNRMLKFDKKQSRRRDIQQKLQQQQTADFFRMNRQNNTTQQCRRVVQFSGSTLDVTSRINLNRTSSSNQRQDPTRSVLNRINNNNNITGRNTNSNNGNQEPANERVGDNSDDDNGRNPTRNYGNRPVNKVGPRKRLF